MKIGETCTRVVSCVSPLSSESARMRKSQVMGQKRHCLIPLDERLHGTA